MRRCLTLALALAAAAGCAPPPPPQAEPGPAAPRPVRFESGEGQGEGTLYLPPGPSWPVVLIPDDYGVGEPIRQAAQRLADGGHAVVVVDLYRGEKVEKLIDAHIMDRALPEGRALNDINGAVGLLLKQPQVRPGRVAVIGWGSGGGWAIDAALADPRVTAVVTCYGRLPTEAETLRPLGASVLGIYAQKDEGNPPETLAAFRKAMAKAGQRLAGLHVLPGCDHGFMLPAPDARPGPRDAEATAEAWRLIVAYLAAELR